jgi:hypothetical protein
MKSYHFFLKDLFDTGMYGGACCTYNLWLAIPRWGFRVEASAEN